METDRITSHMHRQIRCQLLAQMNVLFLRGKGKNLQ